MRGFHIVSTGFIAFLAVACGPDLPCREDDFVHGEHLPKERMLHTRSLDDHAFEVVVRHNEAAEPFVDAWLDSLVVLRRDALLEEMAPLLEAVPPGEPGMPTLPDPLPLFAVTLLPKEASVDARDYAFRASLSWLVSPDPSGPSKGLGFPVGFGVAGCTAGLLVTSSLPFVHVGGIRSAFGDTGAVVGLGISEVALVTRMPTTHVPVAANGFYLEPFVLEMTYACAAR